MIAARWAISNKKSPQAEFAAAERSLLGAEKLDANTGYVLSARMRGSSSSAGRQ